MTKLLARLILLNKADFVSVEKSSQVKGVANNLWIFKSKQYSSQYFFGNEILRSMLNNSKSECLKLFNVTEIQYAILCAKAEILAEEMNR